MSESAQQPAEARAHGSPDDRARTLLPAGGALRAADADRGRVAEVLRRAHDEGRLDLLEYDERLAAAYAARTYADLDALAVDLPPDTATPHRTGVRPSTPASGRARGHLNACAAGPVGRGAVAAWAAVSALNLLIWAVVCLATVSWVHPWWVWVAGPWGAMLLVGAAGAGLARR